MPLKVAASVFAPVAFGAGPGDEVWLVGLADTTKAVRHTGGKWVLQTIPRWVLRPEGGPISATTAVFGQHDVWVFSLGAGAYAAHYDGHAWAKVSMPETPVGVSAVAWNDIWALGTNISYVMHWNGVRWVKVALPLLPLPFGATVSYSNITGVGPKNAWLMRTISYKSAHSPSTAMMHWNGSAWLTAASPADVVDSMISDGSGGLWAIAADINPSGFWFFYHLVHGHWIKFTPAGFVPQYSGALALIPRTHSVWATRTGFNAKGFWYGVLLKYGP
jgi:hypothetical protein